ncbi:uncharacterized protein LOC105217981 isoform X2 [Zeugodacus cucurbitae]|uniref:uncharacterized protein LOC105217981 isoform X2 n=1 Tax=Zeugodacus cucurbitae TaxID=28588 RepID=UPI0023D9196E|nr:uncharacterized protein LOC105217981 isoform X2 [Zeugodacus cucurbitae]
MDVCAYLRINGPIDKSPKMSDWIDEEDGCGFGNGSSQYKDNVDEYVDDGENDYAEHENTDDGNRGFENRRGRGGGRGRGGRGHGGSYGGGHRNFGDNEDNAQRTEFQSPAQNFVPKNFTKATIQEFLPEVPGRIQRINNRNELYCIAKYLLEAYTVCLSTEMIRNNTSSVNAFTESLVARNGYNKEMQQEKFDIDRENFNVIEGVEVDNTANENIEMLDLIGGKRKADYGMQLPKSIDLATANQSKLSDLPDLFKDVMPSTKVQLQTPTSTTLKTARQIPRTVRGVSHRNHVVGIASLELIPDMVGAHITEREYALRQPLPKRNSLRIVPEHQTITNNMREMAYNFFPLEYMWTSAASPCVAEEMPQIPPLAEDQSQLNEGSAMTSASINVARQHVASTSSTMQLVQPHSEGPSLQGFGEQFDTIEQIRNYLPTHTETNGQQERSGILPESTTGSVFFTPYPQAMPAGISSLSDEEQLKNAHAIQHISGHSLVRRTETSTYRTGTLPSIHEEAFHRTLLRRTFRNSELSSTPLRPTDSVAILPHFKNYPTEGSTELTSADNIRSTEAGRQMQMETEGLTEAFDSVEQTTATQQLQHQTAVEIKTEDIVMSAEPLHLVQTSQQSEGFNEPRNWLEILRERQVDLRYNNCGALPKRRRRCYKKRAPPTDPNLTRTVDHHVGVQNDITEVLQALTPLPTQLPEQQVTAVDLTLTRNLHNIEETQSAVIQQPSYEQFIYEHIESISTIMDSLAEWQSMLKACNRNSEQNAATALLPAHYAYDVETLLNADIERLQLKMNILQAIIRNVSFNMMKSRLLKNRRLAAFAFNFLIELESAGIIRIKENGHWVGLI